MKKIIDSKESISWREPTTKDKEAINNGKIKIKQSIIRYIIETMICILIISIGAIVIVYSRYPIVSIALIILLVVTIGHFLTKIIKNISILKELSSNNYKVGDCYINYMEDMEDTDEKDEEFTKQVYVHNDENEYCTEPIKVDKEIEESFSNSSDTKFLIVNIGNKIFRLFKKE